MRTCLDLVRVKLPTGELRCSRGELRDSPIQARLKPYHLQVVPCLCGCGRSVRIVLDCAGYYMTQALSKELRRHPETCGAVGNFESPATQPVEEQENTPQRHDFGWCAERAFDQTYLDQWEGRIGDAFAFCQGVLSNLSRISQWEGCHDPASARLKVALLRNLPDNLQPGAPSAEILSITEFDPAGPGKSKQEWRVPHGTPIGGRLDACGQPIEHHFLVLGEQDRATGDFRRLHAWPIFMSGGVLLHTAHSPPEIALGGVLDQEKLFFWKPPSLDFMAQATGDHPGAILRHLASLKIWPDFFVKDGDRWCLVELAGDDSPDYLLRLAVKKMEYRRLAAENFRFSWAVVIARADHLETIAGSPGNLMARLFPLRS